MIALKREEGQRLEVLFVRLGSLNVRAILEARSRRREIRRVLGRRLAARLSNVDLRPFLIRITVCG